MQSWVGAESVYALRRIIYKVEVFLKYIENFISEKFKMSHINEYKKKKSKKQEVSIWHTRLTPAMCVLPYERPAICGSTLWEPQMSCAALPYEKPAMCCLPYERPAMCGSTL